MALSPVEQDTVSVLRYALNPQKETVPEIRSQWSAVWDELLLQTVAGLVADDASLFKISEKEKQKSLSYYASTLVVFHRLMECQDEIMEALGGIESVVLKGATAAAYYPQPDLRQMGDIDILVRPEEFAQAEEALINSGCIKTDAIERHIGFETKSGINIELHRKFSSGDDRRQNEILDRILFQAIARREFVDVAGHTVPALPKLENGLVLLGHINQHLSSGLGLRQIIDWVMYVRVNLTDTFWNDSFCAIAESVGMRRLAEIITRMCKKYFGLEEITWCDGAEEELADELLEYIFRKGNFGRKNQASNKTVSVMHQFRNPIAAFRYLQAGGMIHWKAAQKHRILRPLAWIYQIGHIIKKGLKRKVKPGKFIEEARQSKQEMAFLSKLGVTRKNG